MNEKTEKVALTPEQINTCRGHIEQTLGYLLHKEPFFASLVLQMEREISNRVPTAGVYVRNKIHLIINPVFFNELDLKARVAVIKHESFHCITNTFSRAKSYDHKLYNIASDIAINQLIWGIPQKFMMNGVECRTATIENFSAAPHNMKLEKLETSEYYYKEVYKKAMENGSSGEGDGTQPSTIDDHEIWKEGYDNETITDNVIKAGVNKAYSEAMERDPGSIPAEVQRMVQELNKGKVDWKSQFRRFVANSSDTYLVDTRKRRNRRFGIYYPGTRVETRLNVVEINDTSGSMSDEQLNEIYNELLAMSKNEVSITSIDCDAAVHQVRKFDAKIKPTFIGRGGTDMSPGLTEALKHTPDCIVVFTDGYIPEPIKVKIPVLWVITNDNMDFKPPYGRVVHMGK